MVLGMWESVSLIWLYLHCPMADVDVDAKSCYKNQELSTVCATTSVIRRGFQHWVELCTWFVVASLALAPAKVWCIHFFHGHMHHDAWSSTIPSPENIFNNNCLILSVVLKCSLAMWYVVSSFPHYSASHAFHVLHLSIWYLKIFSKAGLLKW